MRAFPRATDRFPDGEMRGEGSDGMSLHDYFTAKIMQGFCANPAIFAHDSSVGWNLVNATDEQLIGYARKIADNMLEAREVTTCG